MGGREEVKCRERRCCDKRKGIERDKVQAQMKRGARCTVPLAGLKHTMKGNDQVLMVEVAASHMVVALRK
jgi:hypothetical protein